MTLSQSPTHIQSESTSPVVSWFRGEFAAANALVDALLDHILEVSGDKGEYAEVVEAVRRRRERWMPVVNMQRFYSVGEVVRRLKEVSGRRGKESGGSSHEEQSSVENVETCSDDDAQKICSDHESCITRPERMKICKGFKAKESVKGRMVNVVKGLKMFEDIFVETELSKLTEFVNELRASGRKGELSGETYIFFNKELKGNKREIIQLGVPLFQSTKEEATSTIEPIPSILQNVIDHLVQWRLLPESRKPNSCIINFFDEDEHSQPYFKPPHLDNPISTLFLCETKMAFGRALVTDQDGNYKGSLTLPVKEGSLVVMRGNSADMARHVVCPSSNPRTCITFLKVRPPKAHHPNSPPPQTTSSLTLWQPATPPPHKLQAIIRPPTYIAPTVMSPQWLHPIVMVAPQHIMDNTNMGNGGGTGVFLPWNVGPKKYIKHLPPRIQKRRLHMHSLALPQLGEVDKSSHIKVLA